MMTKRKRSLHLSIRSNSSNFSPFPASRNAVESSLPVNPRALLSLSFFLLIGSDCELICGTMVAALPDDNDDNHV